MSLELTNNNFKEEVIDSSLPVLVDFWAEWCGPCRQLAPTLEKLSENFNDIVVIGKVNVDDNPELSSNYNVRSIPLIAIFKNGEMVEKLVGNQSLDTLTSLLNKYTN